MHKTQPHAQLGQVVLGHPVIPVAVDTNPGDPPDISANLEIPPALGKTRSAPTRPRVVQPQTPQQQVQEEPSQEPVIAPELSPQESAAARSAAQESIETAERNLSLTNGRSLSLTQQDLSSKIRGFMENAREAMRSSDWLRARTLAKKAEVLSVQLASTL